jgi:DNA primase
MARIPEAEIERLKREISLERLVAARGIALVRHGADLVGTCPFHADKTPSLVVSPEKNLWHCLGACQTGGSVLDWVMKTEGLSFRHAVEFLRTGGDVSAAPDVRAAAASAASATAATLDIGESARAGGLRKSTAKRIHDVSLRDADMQGTLQRVVAYYHATLLESPEALSYLQQRGITHPEVVAHFKLGFSNRTLGYRIPNKNRKEGAEVRGRLIELGVLRESGHEHFNGSLVIPLFDEAGHVTSMYGRKITPNLREGTPKHVYLPGATRAVWNAAALGEDVILCESLLDALSFWCAGYRNVTCAYGVEGFSDAHGEVFRAKGVKSVRIAYDRDEAGDRAAEKLAAALQAAGIETYRVLFPKGMDANEYACKVQPSAQSLGLALRRAEWLGTGTQASASPASFQAPEEHTTRQEHDEGGTEIHELSSFAEHAAEPREPSISFLAASSQALGRTAAPEPSAGTGSAAAAAAAPSAAPQSLTLPPHARLTESFRVGEREWRVRAVDKKPALGQLRVTLLLRHAKTGGMFVDTVELYAARQRASFLRQASEELEVEERILKKDLGDILLALETELEAQAKAKDEAAKKQSAGAAMTAERREAALTLLRSPSLLARVASDLSRCGLVGEDDNKCLAYLAVTSRKLDAPLAIVVQSTSAAGKSSLMDAVLALVPEEERVQYSAMTGQSLYYMGAEELKHKVLAIAEEEGASRASYALKLLQSEGSLHIASTGKDPVTGKLVTHAYRVEGPVMIFLTTTAIDVDEELLSRCLVLTVNESPAQTQAIHDKQRESQTLAGILEKRERSSLRQVHQDAQRLLEPLLVANPFATSLSFAHHATRTRRDHMKYLTLIRTIALLHQHQREVKHVSLHGAAVETAGGAAAQAEPVRYIEVTESDIALADHLMAPLLQRALDELPPVTRRLLELLQAWVDGKAAESGVDARDYRFSRREAREALSWSQTQLAVHLQRLEAHEHVAQVRTNGPSGQRVGYTLVTTSTPARAPEASSEAPREAPAGTTRLRSGLTAELSGQREAQSGVYRAENGTLPGASPPGSHAPRGLESGPFMHACALHTPPLSNGLVQEALLPVQSGAS